MKLNEDGKTVAAMDVLAQTSVKLSVDHNVKIVMMSYYRRLKTLACQNEIQWYLDLRKYGSAPHAGLAEVREISTICYWYGEH